MPNSLPNISVYEKQNKTHSSNGYFFIFMQKELQQCMLNATGIESCPLGCFRQNFRESQLNSHTVFFSLLILLAFNWNHTLISIHFKILFWIVFLQSHYRVCLYLVQECVLLGCCVIFFFPPYGCTFWKTVCSLLLRLLADCWEHSRKGIRGYLDRSQRQSFCVFSTSL